MIVKNKNEIAITGLRKKVLDIIEAGITRVMPDNLMKSAVKYDPVRRLLTVNGDEYDVSRGRIFVIGGGKATALMAKALEDILSPENITDGVVNTKNIDCKTTKIKTIEAGHPVPDERGFAGVNEMLALKYRYSLDKNDIVICLISGGGSALMPCPTEGVSLKDKQRLTQLLLASGATIHEINAVRKHLSKLKGGGLGRYFKPATIISLILSDVIGNDLDVIASGLTCPDSSTFSTAYEVITKYNLISQAPEAIIEFLRRGCRGEVEETPKALFNCRNYIIGDNRLALEAMAIEAEQTGLIPYIVTTEQKGDTTVIAKLMTAEILCGRFTGYDIVLLGGETTPKLPENAGRGGRNQHFAAVSMLEMAKYKGEWVAASVGTDGSDYLPDVAGAIVDKLSFAEVRAKNIDVQSHLDRYDSNTLLKNIGHSLIITGSTGTNVGDIIVYALAGDISKNVLL
jgi:glycerate 2-kinase